MIKIREDKKITDELKAAKKKKEEEEEEERKKLNSSNAGTSDYY